MRGWLLPGMQSAAAAMASREGKQSAGGEIDSGKNREVIESPKSKKPGRNDRAFYLILW
jgi:hypothetical protein